MKKWFSFLLIMSCLCACQTPAATPAAQVNRPQIELIAPPSGVRVVQGDELEIETKSSDARGLNRVELWVDDGIYRVDQAVAQPTFHVIQRWRADTPGEHRIKVQAVNVEEQTSQPVLITIEVLDPSLFTATPTAAVTDTPVATATPSPTAAAMPTPTLPLQPTWTATPITPTLPLTATPALTLTPTVQPVQPTGMIFIPAGPFLMGGNDDHVQQAANWCHCGRDRFEDELYMHEVYVSSFNIDKTPVTNKQFAEFVRATGYQTDAEKKNEANTWRTQMTAGKENHPVVWMSWNDANAYCKWAGKRLPTEAEWEKAARGDDARLWPWGNTWDNTKLNMGEGQRGGTTVVGSFPAGASPYGVLDMAGNVWEWVNDWYDPLYYQRGENRDPVGPSSSQDKVLRGGGFNNGNYDVRTANRHKGGPAGYAPDHGFRCAK